MQDYAKMYRRRYEEELPHRKLRQIRWLILKQLPPEILLVLIIAIIFPSQVLPLIKK